MKKSHNENKDYKKLKNQIKPLKKRNLIMDNKDYKNISKL